MRIGFDFDNTIVSYDALFHQLAVEEGLVPATFPVNKLAIRDFLRTENKENLWTAMQGTVYGARMSEAKIFTDVISAMSKLKNQGHTLAIVSHKTQYPYLGPQYDLHEAAHRWIRDTLHIENAPLIDPNHIFFEVTKENKIARISDFNCDIFLDDLPEILLADTFPANTARLLFDPEKQHLHTASSHIQIISSWSHLELYL